MKCHFVHCSLPSEPEGIQTPDLLSAIEARSQLRYRPVDKAKDILLEARSGVKQTIRRIRGEKAVKTLKSPF